MVPESTAELLESPPPSAAAVTFLFTDIEGSTRLWETEQAAMRVALTRHDALIREAIQRYGGHVFKTGGDSFCAAFRTAKDAVSAALAAQQALRVEPWPETARIAVRMGLHTGDAEQRDNDYFGPTLNRVARVMAIAHGGQTLLTGRARELCEKILPAGASLRPLGEQHFKGIEQPEAVFQLCHPDLRLDFPPLKVLLAPADDTTPSIGVLPFVNRSNDPDNEYFADGLSEELMNVLAKIRGLRVASRTSAFSFKGKGTDIPTVAQKLNVANVLEGSVRKSGKRVRINTQLIQVMTDSHLWSETYDRELDDIFAVQDDITHSVVTELRRALMLEPPDKTSGATVKAEVAAAARGRSDNAEAYQFYLQGQFLREQLTHEGSDKAIQCYLQAIQLDPGYALAWAGLSRAYSDQAGQHWVPFADGFARAKAAAQRALDIEPELAEAHVALGWVLRAFDWDWKGAEAEFQRALELAPGSTIAMNGAANLLGTLGRLREAMDLTRKAMLLDPLNVPLHRNYALYCLGAGELQEAESVLHKVLQMSPQGGFTYCWLGILALARDRNEEALALMNNCLLYTSPSPRD